MKTFVSLIVAMLALVFGTTILHAQDMANSCTTDPADGSGLPECRTAADNECYPGGMLVGECTTEWHWSGGWYLARYNRGRLVRDEFPEIYVSLLMKSPRTVAAVNSSANSTAEAASKLPAAGVTASCSIKYSHTTRAMKVSGKWQTPIPGQARGYFYSIFSNGQIDYESEFLDKRDVFASGNSEGMADDLTVVKAHMWIQDANGDLLLITDCAIVNG